MINTSRQYRKVLMEARQLFIKKNKDYGTAWRLLRPASITDQIYIKAARIRSVDTKKEQKIGDSIENEFIGIVNYCLMALMLLRSGEGASPDHLTRENVLAYYDACAEEVFRLMEAKNYDYDEVWRSMRVSSMTDLILMKIVRIKEIEDREADSLVSEGVDANYMDIMNYAIFALILLHESHTPNF
ncbi:MAG TPA: DUF1599 domain-containing protein [Saprospiraceae bacterium]|nr:DUF1599 domain-containing protein [Saprospiraceae bacterium]HNT19323.1 DUF1599 domain-containing protein [Saprospiraceae bacterium]